MCGRYVSPEEAALEREWVRVRVRNPLGLGRTNWNVSPTQCVPVMRRTDDGLDELVAMRWGLIPYWAKGVPPNVAPSVLTQSGIRPM